MNEVVLLRYLHFIGIFAVVSALVAEHLLLKSELKRKEIRRIAIIDGVFGGGAMLVLLAGLCLWLWVGKPAEFYTKNGIFHAKLTLFILVGLLSIVPTIFFLKNRKGDQEEVVAVPKKIVMFVRMELLLVFIIPLLAAMVALGIGLK